MGQKERNMDIKIKIGIGVVAAIILINVVAVIFMPKPSSHFEVTQATSSVTTNSNGKLVVTIETTQKKNSDPSSAPVVKTETKEVRYTASNWEATELRTEPKTSSPSMCIVPKSSIFYVIEEKKDWLYISFENKTGYVPVDYCCDKDGYFRGSFSAVHLTNLCSEIAGAYFTPEERDIILSYEFRYCPDWVAADGGGAAGPFVGLQCPGSRCIYFIDQYSPDFKKGLDSMPAHQKGTVLHEMCHAIDPTYGEDGYVWFTNRLKKAGKDAGLSSVHTHIGFYEYKDVSTNN